MLISGGAITIDSADDSVHSDVTVTVGSQSGDFEAS